jgi:hypothetical protein
MSLVRNERMKLTATYINGISIALFAVGGLAPLFSTLYASAGSAQPMWVIAIVSLICFILSVALHFVARWILRGLVP